MNQPSDGSESYPPADPAQPSPYGPQQYQQPGYPQVPPPGYPQGPYQQPTPWPVPRPTNGMAVASMVLGILWIYWIGSILALVFGYVARRQIQERGESGDGMAVAGIVLGWIGVGIGCAVAIFFLVALGAATSAGY